MKKYGKYIRALAFILGLILIINAMDFAFGQVGEIRWKFINVNKKDSNYDTVILGDSHTKCAIDPNIIDEEAGLNSVNMAINGATVKDMYYILLESCRDNDIKNVVLDVDYLYWMSPQEEGTFNECFVYNQLPASSYVRYKYILDNLNKLDIRNVLAHRTSYSFETSTVKNNISLKLNSDFWNGTIFATNQIKESSCNSGKGYMPVADTCVTNDMEAELCAYDFLSTTTIADCRINYFEEIKEYCDENEINLICITSPITPTSYECLCYEQVNETMEAFFENENVTYYDFNLLKEDVLDRTKDDYVDNEGHMGITLSEEYSTFLGEFLDTVISEDDVDTSIFYENIDEASEDLNNGE